MKLRIRLQNITTSLDLGDGDTKNITLGVLRQQIKVEYGLEISCELSLNKKDVLEGNENVLEEFGIVPGDLIHVMIDDPTSLPPEYKNTITKSEVTRTQHTPESLPNNLMTEMEGASSNMDTEGNEASTSTAAMSSLDDSDANMEPPVNDPVVNHCLSEPLQCCESTTDMVPATLSQLYDSLGSHDDEQDLLWVVVHALALESGLTNLQEDKTTGICMPSNWKNKSFYNTKYCLPESAEVVCSITGVVMRSYLVIHGSVINRDDDDSCIFKSNIRTSRFITDTPNDGAARCYKNLGQLSFTVKNEIFLPLIQDLRSDLGYPMEPHLLSLTNEIKLKILGLLDCSSLLKVDQTCQHFHSLAQDRAVWRKRYLLDFGRRADTSLSQNWYELYKSQYELRKEQRKAMKQMTFLTPGQVWMRPRYQFPMVPMSPYGGDILGGDYDLNPQFQGIPDPFGRRAHNPLQPLMPRPRIDPFGPLPEHNIFHRPGRGGFGGPRMF